MFTDNPEPEKTCGNCGSVYTITSTDYPARERGSINCKVCGVQLMKWNCSREYHATLKKEGEVPNTGK